MIKDGMFYLTEEELRPVNENIAKGIGGLFGVKTTEDEIKDVLKAADYTTSAGRNAAIQEVMKIDPATGRELMKKNADYEATLATTEFNKARAESESFKAKNPNYKDKVKDTTDLRLAKEWRKARPDRIKDYLINNLNFTEEEVGKYYETPARAIEFLRSADRYDDKTGHMRDAVDSFKAYLKEEENEFKLENKYKTSKPEKSPEKSKQTISKQQLWNSDLKD